MRIILSYISLWIYVLFYIVYINNLPYIPTLSILVLSHTLVLTSNTSSSKEAFWTTPLYDITCLLPSLYLSFSKLTVFVYLALIFCLSNPKRMQAPWRQILSLRASSKPNTLQVLNIYWMNKWWLWLIFTYCQILNLYLLFKFQPPHSAALFG